MYFDVDSYCDYIERMTRLLFGGPEDEEEEGTEDNHDYEADDEDDMPF